MACRQSNGIARRRSNSPPAKKRFGPLKRLRVGQGHQFPPALFFQERLSLPPDLQPAPGRLALRRGHWDGSAFHGSSLSSRPDQANRFVCQAVLSLDFPGAEARHQQEADPGVLETELRDLFR